MSLELLLTLLLLLLWSDGLVGVGVAVTMIRSTSVGDEGAIRVASSRDTFFCFFSNCR